MRARRELIRAVVPPLLALALVALLVRPVDSAPVPGIAPPARVTQTTTPSAP